MVDVDNRPLTQLDRQLDRVKGMLASYGAVAATAAAAMVYAGYKMVDAASSVEEHMNILQTTFRSNTQAVLEWSKKSGEAMGRSEYSLQEYVGTYGAFFDSMFSGTGVEIDKLSMKMADLAVDLASFYKVSDEEANVRLSSGLAGETEAVRRWGINLSDERLAQLHKEINGEKVKYKYLDGAAKTQLRITAILRDTVVKQGDAARTAGSWENSLKRVKEKLKTTSVLLGQKIMPFAKGVLLYIETWVDRLPAAVALIAKYATGLKVAFWTTVALATATAAWVASLGLALLNLPKIVAYFTAFAAPVALAVGFALGLLAVFEDIYAFTEGKRSIFGEIIREITGAKAPLVWFENKMARIVELMYALRNPVAAAAVLASGGSLTPLADRSEKAQAASREQGRADAVKSGDGKKFVANMEPDDSTNAPGAALMQYKVQRQMLLKKNPALTTADDVADGVATLSQQAIGDVAREKQAQVQAKADKASGKLTPEAQAAKKKQDDLVEYNTARQVEAKRVGLLKVEVEVKGEVVGGSGKGGATVGPEVGDQITKALKDFNWNSLVPGAAAVQ